MAAHSNNNVQVVNNGIKINGVAIVQQLQFGMEHIVSPMHALMEEHGMNH